MLMSEKATLGVAQRTTLCGLFGDSGSLCVFGPLSSRPTDSYCQIFAAFCSILTHL